MLIFSSGKNWTLNIDQYPMLINTDHQCWSFMPINADPQFRSMPIFSSDQNRILNLDQYPMLINADHQCWSWIPINADHLCWSMQILNSDQCWSLFRSKSDPWFRSIPNVDQYRSSMLIMIHMNSDQCRSILILNSNQCWSLVQIKIRSLI